MSQIIIGYTTEGTTDIRLLESIIVRTFISVGFECEKQIEIISPIIYLKKIIGDTFVNQIFHISKDAFEKGVMAVCVHVDADSPDDTVAMNKMAAAFEHVSVSEDTSVCKNLVSVIPVHMSEAWMLADKQLLKDEIGTNLSDVDLGINHHPESFNDPKATISNAISISRQHLAKRRRRDLSIGELYQPIGQKIGLNKLEALPSYMKFMQSVRNAYRELKLLPPL